MSSAGSDRPRRRPGWPGVVVVFTLAAVCLSLAGGSGEDPKDAGGLGCVPADAVAFVHVRVADLLQTPLGKGVLGSLTKDGEFNRVWEKTEAELGFGLADVESVTVLVLSPPEEAFRDEQGRLSPELLDRAPPELWSPVVVVRTKGPLDRKKLARATLPGSEGLPEGVPVQLLDARTMAVGDPAGLLRYAESVAADGGAGPLAKMLPGGTGQHLIVAGAHVPKVIRQALIFKAQLEGPGSVPPAVAALYPLVNEPASLSVDLGQELVVEAAMPRKNARSAAMAAEAARLLVEFLRQQVGPGGPAGGDLSADLGRELRRALDGVRIEHKGNTARVRLTVPLEADRVKDILAGLARQAEVMASRAQAQNNLKQIGLAMHSFHDANGSLPPAGLPDLRNPKGEPLLSWRVALLPFLEEQELFNQFRTDLPWDHPINKKLIEKMPKVYASPLREKEAAQGLTHYQVFVGPGSVFERVAQPNVPNVRIVSRLTDITDGTSNTIMVAEAAEPVIWTKPDDLPFDPDKELPKLGLGAGGSNVLFCDGSVHFLPRTIADATLRSLITRGGGEVVDFESIAGPRQPFFGGGVKEAIPRIGIDSRDIPFEKLKK